MFAYTDAMPRHRTIPDETVFAATRALLAEGGDKAASFALVARATGLAASSLAQRYASQEGMVRAALTDGWAALMRRTEIAEGEAPLGLKGVPALLKLLGRGDAGEIVLLVTHQADPELRDRAEAWRIRVEAALALRLSGGDGGAEKRGESASMIFAAWQGRLLWQGGGKPDFKLKSVARRLG